MKWITRGFARLCFCLVLLLLCQWTSAAPPAENHLVTNRVRPASEHVSSPNNWSSLNYVASKALGAIVRVASFFYQWMPSLPSFLRPSTTSFRFTGDNGSFQ